MLLNPEERGACLCVCTCVCLWVLQPIRWVSRSQERDGDCEEEERRGGRDCVGGVRCKKRNGASDVLWGLRAPREQTITALSFFSALPPFFSPSVLLLLTQHRGIRQPVYAAPLRLNGITKQEAFNLCTVRGHTRRTVISGAWEKNLSRHCT